eukprot:2204416-Alexandrium_andersonii.AAC.1
MPQRRTCGVAVSRKTLLSTRRRTSASPFLQKFRRRACAPSSGAACVAPGRRRCAGKPCIPRRWRAS